MKIQKLLTKTKKKAKKIKEYKMAISASLVKELREMTGAGMMDCKKALQETDGDLSLIHI